MPKHNNTEDRLSEIVSEHVNRLVAAISEAVREDIAGQLRDFLGGPTSVSRPGRLARATPNGRNTRGCIAPGCMNQSKGPRFRYLCTDHLGASRKDVEAWRAAKAADRARAGRASRVVAGANRPGAKSRRNMDCMAPACTNVSKGPRFRYLCADHLGASKRDIEAWRTAKRAMPRGN
ncbi:MAG: hypothetical protein HY698_16415 [Deltaproteobacteria bacterium]|nr:hypothetical protein [Deltaproteobacteria bacterium]